MEQSCPPQQSKVSLVRPIAFRPTPVTDNQVQQLSQNSQYQPSQDTSNINHPKDSIIQDQRFQQQNKGFAPGHPLVKNTARHYGSKISLLCFNLSDITTDFPNLPNLFF